MLYLQIKPYLPFSSHQNTGEGPLTCRETEQPKGTNPCLVVGEGRSGQGLEAEGTIERCFEHIQGES
jgi:hypothetical protein